MREQFEKLVKELCTLTKLPDAKHVIDGGTMDVNGTTMGLIYNEQVANDRCFVYAEFGLAPQSDPATLLQIHQTLLLRNFLDFTGKGPCFRPGHLDRMRKVFEDPALKHVRIDISWDTVAEQLVCSEEEIMRHEKERLTNPDCPPPKTDPELVKALVNFIETYPDRVLFGSDSLSPNSEAIWDATRRQYAPVFNLLKPETRRKVELENYVEVFVKARAKVRRYEKYVLPYAICAVRRRQDSALPKELLTRALAAMEVGVKYGYDCIAYETTGGAPVKPENYKGLISAAELAKVIFQALPEDGKYLSRLYLGPFEKEVRPLLSGPKAKL